MSGLAIFVIISVEFTPNSQRQNGIEERALYDVLRHMSRFLGKPA